MSMERLTGITENGNVYLIDGPEEDKYGNYTAKGYEQIDDVFDRLAAYEDVGMSPEEINQQTGDYAKLDYLRISYRNDIAALQEENERLKDTNAALQQENHKYCGEKAMIEISYDIKKQENATLKKALEMSVSQAEVAFDTLVKKGLFERKGKKNITVESQINYFIQQAKEEQK